MFIYFSMTLHYQAYLKLFQLSATLKLNFQRWISHENHDIYDYTTSMYHSLIAPTLNRGFIWIPNPFPFLFFSEMCLTESENPKINGEASNSFGRTIDGFCLEITAVSMKTFAIRDASLKFRDCRKVEQISLKKVWVKNI